MGDSLSPNSLISERRHRQSESDVRSGSGKFTDFNNRTNLFDYVK